MTVNNEAPIASARFTGIPRSQEYLDSLADLLARGDGDSVPSGILHCAPMTLFSMDRLDGKQSFALTQGQWEQHYHDLRRGVVKGSELGDTLPELSELKAKAVGVAAEGTVPIAVFNLAHHYPTRRLVAAVVTAARRDRAIGIPDDPGALLVERVGFAASALVPDRFDSLQPLPSRLYGLQQRFVLDPEFYLTNRGLGPDSLRADFGDGQGLRPLLAGEPLAVSFEQPGRKQVRLVQDAGTGALEASFVLEVEPAAAVPPDTTFNVTATIPYQGKCNSGIAYVLYGSSGGVKHTALINPVIISEGFPGGYTWDYLYGMLNTQGTLTTLLGMGYDVVVLTYGQPGANGGSDFIQRSAFVAIACIRQVIQMRSGSASLIVGGASMGGVITRYALGYMEANNIPHQTRLFFSFDSPQQGATVPVSVQFFAEALATFNAAAKPLAALLTSPAAQQMLVYLLPNYTYTGPLTSQMHTAFYTELAALGYPKIKTVGISDGAGNGVKTIPDGAHVIDWYGNICAYGDTWAEMANGQVGSLYAEPLSFWKEFSMSISNCINYDGAPGGTSPANGQLAEQLVNSDYGWVTHNYDINCFIPTISALDISASSLYAPVPQQGAPSAFGSYFVSTGNNAHVLITPQILTFLLAQLGPSEAGSACEMDARLSASPLGAYSQVAEVSAAPAAPPTWEVALSSDGGTACVLCADGVYVFSQSEGSWTLENKLTVQSARAVAVNSDGSVIAVSSISSPSVSVFTGANWAEEATLPMPALSSDQLPIALAISANGSIVVVGVPNLSMNGPGQALVFQNDGSSWSLYVTLSGNGTSEAQFGDTVAIDYAATVVVVGGVNWAYNRPMGGFAYAFTGNAWGTKTQLPEPSTGYFPGYGAQCAVSSDGSTIVVADVGWEPDGGGAKFPGTLFVFSGESWSQRVPIPNPNTSGLYGFAWPNLSDDGKSLAVVASDWVSAQAAYVYTPSGSAWALADTLPLPTPLASTSSAGLAASDDASTVLIGGSLGAYALTGQGWAQVTMLATPVDVGGGDFGSAIAVDDAANLLLVGAPGQSNMVGAAYVYGLSGTIWKQLQQVGSPVTTSMEQFAGAVALSGNADTAVFGARGDSSGAGCAYVLSGYQWSEQTPLTAGQPSPGDSFGTVVAASDDGGVVAIGVPGAGANTGAVDVFSGGRWQERTRLVATGGQPGDNFGASVAISADGSTILAGAPNAGGGDGAAYVFSEANWSQQTQLAPSGVPTGTSFGSAVSLSGNGSVVVVGAPDGAAGAGVVYVFSGQLWTEQATVDVVGSVGDAIGGAVAVANDGSAVLIGAPGTNDRTGMAYLASGSEYGTVTPLVAADGQPSDSFGEQVALNDQCDTAVVGAPGRRYASGTVYVLCQATVDLSEATVRSERLRLGLAVPAEGGLGSFPARRIPPLAVVS